MNDEVKKMIDGIYEYIRNDVFSDPQLLMHNMKVIKFNPNLEWFNCAMIASQHRNDYSVFVNTLERWELICELEENQQLELVHSRKPVKLFYPFYNEEENLFDFSLLETWFLKDFTNTYNVSYFKKSSISIVIEKYQDYSKMIGLLNKTWQNTFLQCYLELFDFYYSANEDLRKFYFQILLYTFGEELRITELEPFVLYENLKLDKLYIYKNLHDLISSFHLALDVYLSNVSKLYHDLSIELQIGNEDSALFRDMAGMVMQRSGEEVTR